MEFQIGGVMRRMVVKIGGGAPYRAIPEHVVRLPRNNPLRPPRGIFLANQIQAGARL